MTDKISAEDLQSVARELQIIRNQIQTLANQINEYAVTLEALSNQDVNRSVFRSFGNLLLEVDDRESLIKEINDAKSTIENHLTILSEKEESTRKSYEEMVQAFEME